MNYLSINDYTHYSNTRTSKEILTIDSVYGRLVGNFLHEGTLFSMINALYE